MAKLLWTQKQDIGPRPRASHAMVYDLARQRLVLFGGDTFDGALRRDTWEWDGENWTQVQDIGPAPRASHAMAHDSARGRSVLFGGRTQTADAGDTWEWDGENWTQVADSGPSKRAAHAMAFDSARQRVVLFGGQAENGTFLNDTWEWDGNEWVQQGDTGPAARVSCALAFDASRGRTVLFGGAGATLDGLGDTWEWDGTAWRQEADLGPDPCAGAAMAFRGAGVALYGGISSIAPGGTPSLFGLTWEWDGKHWTARQDMGPGPRVGHAMAFDDTRSRIVLFGGLPVRSEDSEASLRVMGDTREQLVPAAPAGGGGGGAIVQVASLNISPNPLSPVWTGPVTFTVNLASPAPGAAQVGLFYDFDPGNQFAAVPIAAGAMSGTLDFPLGSSHPLVNGRIFARSGTSEAGKNFSIF